MRSLLAFEDAVPTAVRVTACTTAMTVAARGGQWSDTDLAFPDGYVEAVAAEMEDFAPCAVWDPARAELHACMVHAVPLAEEVDRRHFDDGLVGPDAWLDDHQVEILWDTHREVHEPLDD